MCVNLPTSPEHGLRPQPQDKVKLKTPLIGVSHYVYSGYSLTTWMIRRAKGPSPMGLARRKRRLMSQPQPTHLPAFGFNNLTPEWEANFNSTASVATLFASISF